MVVLMPHKHQLQSDGPDQLSSSCSPDAGKLCFFAEKPYYIRNRFEKELVKLKESCLQNHSTMFTDAGKLHVGSDERMMWGNDRVPQHISVCFL